jgi:hypothetical protein
MESGCLWRGARSDCLGLGRASFGFRDILRWDRIRVIVRQAMVYIVMTCCHQNHEVMLSCDWFVGFSVVSWGHKSFAVRSPKGSEYPVWPASAHVSIPPKDTLKCLVYTSKSLMKVASDSEDC